MSEYDVTPDDEPIDVVAVAADDHLVERMRHALSPDAAVIWDDEDDELDPAFAVLRTLQRDVSADLPAHSVLPARVTELLPRRRHLSRGATVAAIAAGVLSIGGVAAAASAPGLSGVRSAVSNAVHDAMDAITPDAPVGPAVASPSSKASPSPKATPRGEVISTAARSASAVRQIEANLERAKTFLDEGKPGPAKNQLDAAARKLAYVVAGADRTRLATRLAALRARLALTPDAKPSREARDKDNSGKDNSGRRSDNSGKDGRDDDSRDGEGRDSSGSGRDGRPEVEKSPGVTPSRGPRTDSSGPGSVDEPHEVETPRADDDSSGRDD